MGKEKYGLKMAVFVIATTFDLYAVKAGNLDWLPNWALLLVMGFAGVYWLFTDPNVREAVSYAFVVETGKLIHPETFQPLARPRYRRRKVAWKIALVMLVFMGIGCGLWALRLFSNPAIDINSHSFIPAPPPWAIFKSPIPRLQVHQQKSQGPTNGSSSKPQTVSRPKSVAVQSKSKLEPMSPPSPSNEQSYDWSISVKEVLPPGEAEANAMKPVLAEKDRVKRMETKELLAYYDQKAEDLELFSTAWEPKQNDYDSQACQGPANDTPEASKLCDLVNKAENERLSNYLKYREELPKAREKAFKASFSLILAAVEVLIEKCESKKITPEQIQITAENAYGISLFFRTYRDQCLGSN